MVFDTAFHATIEPEAATYAVPARWREEWGVRRYGFHGLAVQSVAEQVQVPRLVVCHLGGGCSFTAVRDGRSADTTMGFSPLEGVPMATRSGSVDPGALLYLLRERGLSLAELDHALHEESGLAALGGLDEPLGLAVYTYRVAQARGRDGRRARRARRARLFGRRRREPGPRARRGRGTARLPRALPGRGGRPTRTRSSRARCAPCSADATPQPRGRRDNATVESP